MEWMILPLKRYADFEGRSRRLEYWMFQLFQWLVTIAVFIVAAMFGAFSDMEEGAELPVALIGLIAFFVIGYLAIFIPSIAVTVRRLHDRDMTGWLYLLIFVPYIGPLVLFVFTVLPGTPGENQYGPDPLDPDSDQLESVFS